ncbi:MAG TPA: hypothetical protein VIK86_02865 [Candidatus Paceibacterota bacterium]
MNYLFSAILGLIQICIYTVPDANVKIFLSYLQIAVIFALLGLNLGRAGF